MSVWVIIGLATALLQLTGCRQGASENLRGKNQPIITTETTASEGENSDDATSVNTPNQTTTISQQAIVAESGNLQPLRLTAEADQSALPAGFMEDIFAIHKFTANKSILFAKSKQAWLLDETKEGALSKLTVDFTPPTGTTLYVLENKNFWLLGKSSLAFPSTVASSDPGQLNLINLSPDLLKDPSNIIRVLFAGPQRFIIANEKKANIIKLDGDTARVIALDFPKANDIPLPIYSAGLMNGNDAYWFLSKDRLLLLKKDSNNIWQWLISRYKLDAQGVPPEVILDQVAMLIEQGADKNINYLGRTFELVAGKVYEQNAIKLSLEATLNPAIDPLFISDIQPILKNSCISCHPGYDVYATVKAKAADFETRISNGSMPKGSTLTPAQIKTLTDYMIKLKLGN